MPDLRPDIELTSISTKQQACYAQAVLLMVTT